MQKNKIRFLFLIPAYNSTPRKLRISPGEMIHFDKQGSKESELVGTEKNFLNRTMITQTLRL